MKRNMTCLYDSSVGLLIDRPKQITKRNIEHLLKSVQDDEQDDAASIYLRLRPIDSPPHYEIAENVLKIWNPEQTAQPNDCQKAFTFSAIFEENAKQREVYNSAVAGSIENDESLSILMYGTSGSGKTYTLMGEADKPGIIPRAIEHIFSRYGDTISIVPTFKINQGTFMMLTDEEMENEEKQRKIYFTNPSSIYLGAREKMQLEHQFIKLEHKNTSVCLWISFVEIYNENVYDLLRPSQDVIHKRNCLKVISNGGNSFVQNATSIFVTSVEEASTLLTIGLNSRQNAATNINTISSRSHCIFSIDVIKHVKTVGVTHFSYKFSDLAGSERVKKSETTGCRLRETQNINTSLLVLGRCLNTVYNNQKKKKNELVPFRESKLTQILQSALLGKEKLTMIVNVLPKVEFLDENINVLQYASMAQNIIYKKPPKERRCSRNTRFSIFMAQACGHSTRVADAENVEPQLSLLMDENYRLREQNDDLVNEIDELQEEINYLKEDMIRNEFELRNQLVDEFDERLRKNEEACEDRAKQMITYLKKRHATEISELKAKLQRRDNEITDLYDEIDILRAKGISSDQGDYDEDYDEDNDEDEDESVHSQDRENEGQDLGDESQARGNRESTIIISP